MLKKDYTLEIKKFLGVVCLIVLTVVLVACGSDGDHPLVGNWRRTSGNTRIGVVDYSVVARIHEPDGTGILIEQAGLVINRYDPPDGHHMIEWEVRDDRIIITFDDGTELSQCYELDGNTLTIRDGEGREFTYTRFED